MSYKHRTNYSPECSYKKKKLDYDNFPFELYKYELNKIICAFGKENIVDDANDFWLFFNKYQSVKKKKNDKQTSIPQVHLSTDGLPEIIVKDYERKKNQLNNIDSLFFKFPVYDPEYERRPQITLQLFTEFMQIVKLYINFKLKESRTKLEKLREIQKNLPIYKYRNEILDAVQNEQVVLIAGDTGCGKSTQVPQYLYNAGFNRIACTQPRRIACISLAKRVAIETTTENKTDVGYQIRFEKSKNKETKIIFMTEGLLLRQLSTENDDFDFDVIILDEVHERHLHGDFLLGVVKCLIRQRPTLKIVLMSATINIEMFSKYFNAENVKVIEVPGRLYPIKLYYKPINEDKYNKTDRFNPKPYVQIMQLIDEKYSKNEKGDLLIFLSGLKEITAVIEAAKEYSKTNESWIVLPLHSALSLAEQDKVFDYPPDGVRKCIVSTNIAETSVTIDGVRFVIDSGKVKEMSYDSVSRMQRLKEFWVSRASAEQRKGRAGRTGPGICFRLYSEEIFEQLEPYSTPEILRVPLDSLLLQMIAMGLPDARQFPFIEPPSCDNIENSIISLRNIGALTEKEELTVIGKALSRLPLDIILGKMLILSCVFHQVDPVLSLAATLSVQSPFTNRAYRDLECRSKLKELESDHGDPIILLNLYREWLEIKYREESMSNSSRKWCRHRGLEEQRFYETTKLRTQFKDLLEDCSLLDTNTSQLQSSADRSIRFGELRHLRKLRREHKSKGVRKRRLLKMDLYDLGNEEQFDDDDVDIRDVEFRLSNDNKKMEKLLSGATACNYKDIIILKLIVCSGLYPQFAVADEFNFCKSSNEQLFHTKTKAFVALHPMSYFGNNPECLQLHDSQIEVPPDGYYSKRPLSSKHQILFFLSLLETTKPYLVNTLRMPTAQTLLLFAQCIETNSTFTRIVCDSWILLEFPFLETGQILLQKASKLRAKWDKLLLKKLSVLFNEKDQNEEKDILENNLEEELIAYMQTEISYTVNRLLPADLKILYVGYGQNIEEIDRNPFSDTFVPVAYKKGGMQLAINIFFNCLVETEWSINVAMQIEQIPWTCQGCNIEYCFSSIQKLVHQISCKAVKVNDKSVLENLNTPQKSNTIRYECTLCQKDFYLTPIEILKHKKHHL